MHHPYTDLLDTNDAIKDVLNNDLLETFDYELIAFSFPFGKEQWKKSL